MEHFFTTYVRTKMVFQQRFKDSPVDFVKIYLYELKKLNVNGWLLHDLKLRREITYDDEGNFRPLLKGDIRPELLLITKRVSKQKVPEQEYHLCMKRTLLHVTIDLELTTLPVYFQAFLRHRQKHLDSFFRVDNFSGRVHTPIVNLKGEMRHALRIKGEKLCSLDVKQMQPLILGKVLKECVGDNPFSKALDNGEDIYVLLLNQNDSLKSRDEAKTFLYRLIFGYPMTDIGRLFQGDTAWVEWINSYKVRDEPNNPHHHDTHTNLAWLLQSQEVRIMTQIWKRLCDKGIDFLTIHDDILVRKRNKDFVYQLMGEVLGKEFHKYDIIMKCY